MEQVGPCGRGRSTHCNVSTESKSSVHMLTSWHGTVESIKFEQTWVHNALEISPAVFFRQAQAWSSHHIPAQRCQRAELRHVCVQGCSAPG